MRACTILSAGLGVDNTGEVIKEEVLEKYCCVVVVDVVALDGVSLVDFVAKLDEPALDVFNMVIEVLVAEFAG